MRRTTVTFYLWLLLAICLSGCTYTGPQSATASDLPTVSVVTATPAPADSPTAEAGEAATAPLPTAEPTVEPLDGLLVHGYLGYIGSDEGGQDYVQFLPEDAIPRYGVVGASDEIAARLAEVRDAPEPDRYQNLYGQMECDVDAPNGCQLVVSYVRLPMEQTNPETVSALTGQIVSLGAESEYDDKLVLNGPLPVEIGLSSAIFENGYPMLDKSIAALRDSDAPVSLDGQIVCGVPDVNGCQLQVAAMAVDGEPVDPLGDWPTYEDAAWGLSLRYPSEAEVVRDDDLLKVTWDDTELVFGCSTQGQTEGIWYGHTESLGDAGWAWFLGFQEPKLAWRVDGRLLGVRYGEPDSVRDGGTIQRGDLTCTISLWATGESAFATADINAQTVETGDIIVSSVSPLVSATGQMVGMANPASVYCEQMGGQVDIRTDAEGGQYGVCVFEYGECNEWALYRGECMPPEPPTPTPLPVPTEAHLETSYVNEGLGYGLDLPSTWLAQDMGDYTLFTNQTDGRGYVLFIGVRAEGATEPVFRTGMPAGDLVSGGSVDVLNYAVRRNLLVLDGRTKVVSYDLIRSGGREFVIYLDAVSTETEPYDMLDIPVSVQSGADAIVASLQLLD